MRLARISGLRCLWVLTLVSLSSLVAQAAAPTGWRLSGSKPGEYESGLDANAVYEGHASGYLKSITPVADGFGTLMQDINASHYAGKRVRITAFVRAEEVHDWAGLWMRVDKDSLVVAFDNMQGRPIKGTVGWQSYEVVLDVPADATGIFFGVLLSGSGSMWLNNVKLEPVGSDVAVTGKALQRPQNLDPVNLSFDRQ